MKAKHRRRKERAIRRGEEDSPATALEDLELVVEHDGLKIQLIEATADEQAEQPAQKPVSDGPEHLGSLMPGWPACQRPGRSGRSSFFTPQARIFWEETLVIVSVTSWGDAIWRVNDQAPYRVAGAELRRRWQALRLGGITALPLARAEGWLFEARMTAVLESP